MPSTCTGDNKTTALKRESAFKLLTYLCQRSETSTIQGQQNLKLLCSDLLVLNGTATCRFQPAGWCDTTDVQRAALSPR